MPIDSYKPPPRIPGVLYKVKVSHLIIEAILLLFLGSAVLYFSNSLAVDLPPAVFWFLGVLFFVYGLAKLFYSNEAIFVRVTPSDVTAKLLKGASIDHDDLKNYVLYIDTSPKRTTRTSAYRYRISLARTTPYFPKNKTEQQPIPYRTNGYGAFVYTGQPLLRLPLVDNLMTPQNVREWTDAFQSQIASPLPILFKSDQLKRDFDSGIYQCPYPKKS